MEMKLQEITYLLQAPAVSATIGGLTGLAGSWFINWRTYSRDKKDKAKATLTAIKAEIFSIVQLMEFADYEKGITKAIDHIEKFNEPRFFEVPVKIDLFTQVYSANVSNLGLVKPEHLPYIVSFYGNVHGMIMDLEHLKNKPNPLPVQDLLYICKKDLERVIATIALGKQIQGLLTPA